MQRYIIMQDAEDLVALGVGGSRVLTGRVVRGGPLFIFCCLLRLEQLTQTSSWRCDGNKQYK